MRGRLAVARGVAVALVASTAALLLSIVFVPVLPHTRLVLFYAAVIGAAWYGGHLAGIVATILCAAAAEVFILPPSTIELTSAAALRLTLFGATAYGSVALLSALRRSRQAAEQSAGEARQLAGRLEEQAGALESRAAESKELAQEFQRVNEQLRERNEEAERVARRTRRLQGTTAALLRTITPQQVARVIMTEGLGAIEAELGLLALLGADDKTVRVSSARGYPSERLERAKVLPIDSPSAISVAIRTGEPVWMSAGGDPLPGQPADRGDSAANGGGGPKEAGDAQATWAVLPLTGRERMVGAIALGFRHDVDFSDEEKTLMLLLAQECAQALERARLYEAERNARVKAEFAERQIAFLAEASNRLAISLDSDASLQSVAKLAVPELADWCLIHVATDTGGLRIVAAEHSNEQSGEVLSEIVRRFPPRASAPIGPGRVQQTGRSELVREVTPDLLESGAWDEDHLALLRQLAPRSEICVPMSAHDRVLGTITLVVAESGRRYTPADLALAEELASRAAQAIENARLFQDTRSASAAKSDFLAVMSHELRTPLNAILGYADLVLLGVPGDIAQKTRNYVERIRTSAQDLLRLVDEVLSFARLESGKEAIRLEIVDVNILVREAVALVEAAAEAKGIQLSVQLPDTPVEIETDGWKVRQIVSNLLSNAVKFTAQGGVEVTVVTDPTGPCVHVRDTGIGIPAEHIDHIFDPFWQVEQTSTRRYGGAGLGLGVARELAKLLGGDLTVESEVGVGSTFTLRLPVRRAREAKPSA